MVAFGLAVPKLLSFSDLHLWDDADPLAESVCRLWDRELQSGDTLVLLGDIFDFNVGGRDCFRARYFKVYASIEAAARRGVQTHFAEGNHDFWMRRAFASLPGFELHPRDFEVVLDGRRFYFAHGDEVDTSDYGYRALRGLLRSPLVWALAHGLPERWVEAIGNRGSRYSRESRLQPGAPEGPAQAQAPERLRNLYREFAQARFREGYEFVVLGHNHLRDEFRSGTKQYLNNGFPRTDGVCIAWSSDTPDQLLFKAIAPV